MGRARTDFDLTWPALLTGVLLALACVAPGLPPSEPRRMEATLAATEPSSIEPASIEPEASEPVRAPSELDLLRTDLETKRKEVTAQRAALLIDTRRLVKSQSDAQQAGQDAAERRSQLAGRTLISRADLEKQRADLMGQIADMQQRAMQLRKQMLEKRSAPAPLAVAGAAKVSSGTQYIECFNGAVVLIPQGTRYSVVELRARDPGFVRAVNGNSVAFLVHPLGFSSFQAARELAEGSGVKSLGYEPVEGTAP